MVKEKRETLCSKKVDLGRQLDILSCRTRVRIYVENQTLVDTKCTVTLKQRGLPPIYLVPIEHVQLATLHSSERQVTHAAGVAKFFSVGLMDKVICNAGWFFPRPGRRELALRRHVAFFAHKFDACYLGNDLISRQESETPGWVLDAERSGAMRDGASRLTCRSAGLKAQKETSYL